MDRSQQPRGPPAAHRPVHPSEAETPISDANPSSDTIAGDHRAANRLSQVREDSPHTQDIADSRASLTSSPRTPHTQLSSELTAPLGAAQGASQQDNSTCASGIRHPPASPYSYAQAGQFGSPTDQYTLSPYSNGYGQALLQQTSPAVTTGYTQGYASAYTPAPASGYTQAPASGYTQGSASGYLQGPASAYTQGHHVEQPRQSTQFSQQQTNAARQAPPSQDAPYAGVNAQSVPHRPQSEHERARPRPAPIFIPSTSSAYQPRQQGQAGSSSHISGQGQHVSPMYPASSLPPQQYYFQHGGGHAIQVQQAQMQQTQVQQAQMQQVQMQQAQIRQAQIQQARQEQAQIQQAQVHRGGHAIQVQQDQMQQTQVQQAQMQQVQLQQAQIRQAQIQQAQAQRAQVQQGYAVTAPNNSTPHARPEGPSAAPVPSQTQQAPRVNRRQRTAFQELLVPRQNASTPAALPAPAVQQNRKRKTTRDENGPRTPAPAFRNTPDNQNIPEHIVAASFPQTNAYASPYPPHTPAPFTLPVPVARPPPPDPDTLPQAITSTYDRYRWSVYHFTVVTTRYDFADMFLEDLYRLRDLRAHRWRTHSTRGFISQGTRLSFLVLFNAADPFDSSNTVKYTTTLGCYGRYGHEAHKEIYWITFAADLRNLVQQMMDEKYIVLTRKWTSKENDPAQARFHKAYWLCANLEPLLRLLNHAGIGEDAHDKLTGEEEEKLTEGFEVDEGDLQGGWAGGAWVGEEWVEESVEVKSEEVKSEEVKSEGVKSEEVKSEGVKSEEVKSEEVKSEEVKSEEVKSEEVKSEEVKSEEVKREEVKSVKVESVEVKGEEATESRSEAIWAEIVKEAEVWRKYVERWGDDDVDHFVTGGSEGW